MRKKSFLLPAVAALAAGSLLLTSGCRTSELSRYQMTWDDCLKAVIVSRDGKFLMSYSDQEIQPSASARFNDKLTVYWFPEDTDGKGLSSIIINKTGSEDENAYMDYSDLNGDMIFDQKCVPLSEKGFFRYKDKWVPGKSVMPARKKETAELDGIGPVYFQDGVWVPGKRPAATAGKVQPISGGAAKETVPRK